MAIVFKHRYKSGSLIGTGAVKFRPYTVSQPLPQLATPQNVTADGTVVSWDEVENATSYAVLADGSEIGTVENVTQDALAGTWVFKDTLGFDDLGISQEDTIEFRFNFISDNSEMKTLIVNSGLTPEAKTVYEVIYVVSPEGGSIGEPTTVYYSADVPDSGVIKGWTSSSYKTIEVTSKLSEVTNGEQLLAWLQANATKQSTSTPTLISFTIAGNAYQAEEGMTWAQWVESSYNTGGFYILDGRIKTTGLNFVATVNVPSTTYAVSTTDTITRDAVYYLPIIGIEPPSGGGGIGN